MADPPMTVKRQALACDRSLALMVMLFFPGAFSFDLPRALGRKASDEFALTDSGAR
jgi:hypothetical protein